MNWDGEHMNTKISYSQALHRAHRFLLENYEDYFIIGQGLWSPWYVGDTMTGLDIEFGRDRVIDTPVSECGITGLAVGAAVTGKKVTVVHPRMDFALYAMDPIVNQAAKWKSMFSSTDALNLCIRMIINRGGEQGAQHSQALHSWFAHVPGLKVVMPSSAEDAYHLYIAAVLDPDPVIFVEDRWLYQSESAIDESKFIEDLNSIKPTRIQNGNDLTIVSCGYSTEVVKKAMSQTGLLHLSADIFDCALISPFTEVDVVNSVCRTGKILVIDGGWSPCGFSSEVVAKVMENEKIGAHSIDCRRVTIPFLAAPNNRVLEKSYYVGHEMLAGHITNFLNM